MKILQGNFFLRIFFLQEGNYHKICYRKYRQKSHEKTWKIIIFEKILKNIMKGHWKFFYQKSVNAKKINVYIFYYHSITIILPLHWLKIEFHSTKMLNIFPTQTVINGLSTYQYFTTKIYVEVVFEIYVEVVFEITVSVNNIFIY